MISFFDNLLLCQRWLFAQHSVSVRSVFKSAEESFNYVSVNDSITANRRRQTAVSLRRYWTTTNGLSSACAGWRLFAWMFSVMKDNMHHYRGKASWSVLQCAVLTYLQLHCDVTGNAQSILMHAILCTFLVATSAFYLTLKCSFFRQSWLNSTKCLYQLRSCGRARSTTVSIIWHIQFKLIFFPPLQSVLSRPLLL